MDELRRKLQVATATIAMLHRRDGDVTFAAHQPLVAVQGIGINLLGQLLPLFAQLRQLLANQRRPLLQIIFLRLGFGRHFLQPPLRLFQRRLKLLGSLHQFQLGILDLR